ncbi:hypothetical protein IRJ41_023381, partial [Triplophysa rosa]
GGSKTDKEAQSLRVHACVCALKGPRMSGQMMEDGGQEKEDDIVELQKRERHDSFEEPAVCCT